MRAASAVPKFVAVLCRDPQSPSTDPQFSVEVRVHSGIDAAPVTVMAQESYAVASQLTDALNYKFGHGGALSAMGRAVYASGSEVAEVADNVYQRVMRGAQA